MKSNSQRIFISYSRRGDGLKWKSMLLRAFGVFEKHLLLDVWEDGRIRVGSAWDGDVKQAMGSASIAVLLLTEEALDNEYIRNTELPFLRQRQEQDQLSVVPVICEPCNWKSHDWLQATYAPNNGRPLSELSEADRVNVLRRLAVDIAQELSRIALSFSLSSVGERNAVKTYLDRFPLTPSAGMGQEMLIGRDQELALLDLALAEPQIGIVSLVAWGGVGKTMLIQHWLRRLQCEGWYGAQRVYAWSFYSQGAKEDRQASEDPFLTHALEWFGVQCEPTLLPRDKGRLLADAMVRERTLLILDGIEPLQYPPGPMGGRFRAPGVQSLLKHLARRVSDFNSPEIHRQILCLVTTREPLSDLSDIQRRPGATSGSMLSVKLDNLTEEAGAALLHHAGVKRAGAAKIKADDTELLAASREVDGHALTLKLLGRFLARAHGGDIRRRDSVKFEEADRKEQGGTTFKMLAAFENWFAKSGELGARQLAILRILGLFDRPPDVGCLEALRKPPIVIGLTDSLFTTCPDSIDGQNKLLPLVDEDWQTAISFLADFGLVADPMQSCDAEYLLDCHPLVREYFANKLHHSHCHAWLESHRRLYRHLENAVEFQPSTFGGLQVLYQAGVHGCHAHLLEDVLWKIYEIRIQRENQKFALKMMGTLSSNLALLSCFFQHPWDTLVGKMNPRSEGRLYNEVALHLRAIGWLEQAITPSLLACQKHIALPDWTEAAVSSGNHAELAMLLGDVAGATTTASRAVEYADKSPDLEEQVYQRSVWAEAAMCDGDGRLAARLLEKAESIQVLREPLRPALYGAPGYRLHTLLLSQTEVKVWGKQLGQQIQSDLSKALKTLSEVFLLAKTAKTFTHQEGWIFGMGLHELTMGECVLFVRILGLSVSFASLDLDANHLDSAVELCRQSGIISHLIRSLRSRAWQHFVAGNPNGAKVDLDEAWEHANRGPMQLHMIDILLYRVRLFFREKDYVWRSPEDDLAAVEQMIRKFGYHRRDQELADAKQTILQNSFKHE